MSKGKTTKENTWQCIEYWIKRNPDKTVEECQKMLDERRLSRRLSNPTNIQYWINKYPEKTEKECQDMFQQYKYIHCKQRIEYWINKYPEKTENECQKLLDEYKREYTSRRPNSSGRNNPAHHSKTTTQERRERSSMCIEYWIKKYPNNTLGENERLLQEHKQIIKEKLQDKSNQPKCVEYWVSKGYSVEEAKNIISKSQETFSKRKCIEKYGEQEGLEIFNDRQRRWLNSMRHHFEKCGDGRAPQSEKAQYIFEKIFKHYKLHKPLTEKYIHDITNDRSWAYDFCYKNIIIEFNGDFWHMNPKKYSADFINPVSQIKASDKWELDRLKIQCAESYNYKVLTVWESEYDEDISKLVKKCIKFIDDNISN